MDPLKASDKIAVWLLVATLVAPEVEGVCEAFLKIRKRSKLSEHRFTTLDRHETNHKGLALAGKNVADKLPIDRAAYGVGRAEAKE